MIDNQQNPSNQNAPSDDPPMSLAEARRVIWQTRPKEPMGQLLDRGELTRDDLEWAIRKAYRPDVRRAAQRLLQELDQPTAPAAIATDPPRYGPQVIIASDYLEQQQENHFGALGVAIGVGVMVCIYSLIDAVRSLLAGQPANVPASVGFVLSMALGVWYVRRYGRAWRRMQRGRTGEDQVVGQLRQALDHRWTLYRNLQLPDRRDDLDVVLVGPGGVWVVQVKATGAPLRVHEGRWQVRRGGRWSAAQPDPGAQAKGQAMQLNDFCKRHGIDRFVEPAVALSEAQPFDAFAGSAVPVWLPFDIEAKARQLATRRPPADDELRAINELLRKRADEQRVEERTRRR